MGEPIRTRKGKFAGRGQHDSCGASQKKGRIKSAHLSSAGKKSSLTMMQRNRKNKKNGKKRRHIAGRAYDTGHGEQGNIKMAVSEDHASCWVHKDLTFTTKQNQALLTAARASGGKDECQVRLIGIEREYWMGTEIGRLGSYGFRGTVQAGDGSNQKGGEVGAGYVNLRKQRKR